MLTKINNYLIIFFFYCYFDSFYIAILLLFDELIKYLQKIKYVKIANFFKKYILSCMLIISSGILLYIISLPIDTLDKNIPHGGNVNVFLTIAKIFILVFICLAILLLPIVWKIRINNIFYNIILQSVKKHLSFIPTTIAILSYIIGIIWILQYLDETGIYDQINTQETYYNLITSSYLYSIFPYIFLFSISTILIWSLFTLLSHYIYYLVSIRYLIKESTKMQKIGIFTWSIIIIALLVLCVSYFHNNLKRYTTTELILTNYILLIATVNFLFYSLLTLLTTYPIGDTIKVYFIRKENFKIISTMVFIFSLSVSFFIIPPYDLFKHALHYTNVIQCNINNNRKEGIKKCKDISKYIISRDFMNKNTLPLVKGNESKSAVIVKGYFPWNIGEKVVFCSVDDGNNKQNCFLIYKKDINPIVHIDPYQK